MEELIMSKARDLFFNYGLRSISMDDLARGAGVSKKTVYQFVSDKNELVGKVAQNLVACHREELERCRQKAANAVEEVALQVREPFATLAAINHSFFYDLEKFFPAAWQVIAEHRNKDLLPFITGNLDRGMGEGVYREDLDLDLTPHIRLQQLQTALQPGPLTGVFPECTQLMNRLTRFYLQAITSRKGSGLIDKYLNKPTI